MSETNTQEPGELLIVGPVLPDQLKGAGLPRLSLMGLKPPVVLEVIRTPAGRYTVMIRAAEHTKALTHGTNLRSTIHRAVKIMEARYVLRIKANADRLLGLAP